MSTPTSRTLQECKRLGWGATVVERYNHHVRRRFDAFGFGDLLVLDGQPGALLVQACSENGGHAAKRVLKITTECALQARSWLEAGNRIEIWAWGLKGKAGKRKRYEVRRVPVTKEMLG